MSMQHLTAADRAYYERVRHANSDATTPGFLDPGPAPEGFSGRFNKPDDPEIGLELKASELVEGAVVVTRRDDHEAFVTMWVKAVYSRLVVFYAGELRLTFLAMRATNDRDKLIDDTGKQMHVYRYLGVI